ncbi:Mitochondrial outer membrane protein iml2 [Coniosporium tulheliwenetii]|uniref:Mitochondrial outer membrane protein iml2 n=1 Tax=Coniosporium tulheliwenetii TaxID=3383036 RepID=A0ACC2ZJZ7_9PEZI|nr:Mitochondrial outer membrane protein iml2 [Cladosporium sp. JES 115]
MSRLAGWIGSKAKPHGSSQSLNALEEPSQIEHAMRAATHIMNDDVETAEAELSKGSSPSTSSAKAS